MTKGSLFAWLAGACALCAQALTPGAAPVAGAPDDSFGQGGVSYVNFGQVLGNMAGHTGVALQADGKIVAVGTEAFGGSTVARVVRYNPGGSVDSTFSFPGFEPFGATAFAEALAVAIQPDGKIVVAGRNSLDMVVARLNPDGSFDATFNGNGRAAVNPSPSQAGDTATANAVAIQPDGKIVVAGSKTAQFSSSSFLLVRFNGNGSLDASFNGTGLAVAGLGNGAEVAYALAIQADGRIVAGGRRNPPFEDFALARYNADGTPDSTFGGVRLLDFGGGADSIRALHVQADGKILATGYATVAGNLDFGMARYNADGTPDTSFNGTGRVTHSFLPTSAPDAAYGMAALADGRILAAGYHFDGARNGLAMMRFTSSGALDTSFAGGTGKFMAALPADSALNAVVLQADGNAVAVGYFGSVRDFLATRVNAAGALDTSFGSQGFAITPSSPTSDVAHATAVQADGKVVSAGSTTRFNGPNPLAIVRQNANGALDSGFGTSGRVTNDVGGFTFLPPSAHAHALAIEPGGRIIVAGDWGYQPTGTGARPVRNFVVSRYTTAGAAQATVQTSLEYYSVGRAIRLQADGKAVVAGYTFEPAIFQTQPAGPRKFGLARYNTDLSLDSAFNGNGKAVTPVGSGDAEANALAIQADGRILAAGYAFQGSNRDFAIVRYSAAGSAEGAFLVDIGPGTDDSAYAIVVQPDGKILIAGSAGNQSALVRFDSPGLYDATFAEGGRFLFPGAPIVSIALQPDGKILALTRDFQVWRLTAGGVPDTTFGLAGRVAFAMGPFSSAGGIALQPDGRIVVAGTAASVAGGNDFVIARIDPAGAITLGPAGGSYDFGAQSMNTTQPAESIVLVNGGAASAVNAVTATGDFAVTSNGCAALATGASCPMGIAFRPTSEGARKGTLLVEYSPRPRAIAVTLGGTGERSLVTHYYRSILRRSPDTAGKAFWQGESARVTALGANVNETWFAMAQTFYASPEYLSFNRDNAAFVTDLYNTFFNRAPDVAGLAYWTGQLDSGLPREVLLAQFMFSPEFAAFAQAIFGSAAVRAEVNVVMDFYRGLLGRLPDNAGFNYWVGRFRTAQCQGQSAVTAEVEAISSAFTLSGEYAARGRANAQYVGDLYNAFLRRGGDLGGVQYWINQVASAARTREEVRVEFRKSPEFQARANAIVQQGCLQ